jgi:hypothetical protein
LIHAKSYSRGRKPKQWPRSSKFSGRALGLLRWIHGPEPAPRRPGAPLDKPAVENITERERAGKIAEVYHRALLIVHADKKSDGPLDRDEVTRLFTELYDAAMIGR